MKKSNQCVLLFDTNNILSSEVISTSLIVFIFQEKLESELQMIEDKFEIKKKKFIESSESFNAELKKVGTFFLYCSTFFIVSA